MEIITADFETYYDKEYSLTKMTTEAYINDPRFEVIMLGLRWPDGTYEVVEGSHEEIKYRLDAIDWSQYAVLAHHTLFDGAILGWKFGVKPKAWLDTLSMARAMHGLKGNSLAALAKKYGLEDKGSYVVNMMGRRRADMSPGEFQQYKEYCLHDVELCNQLFTLMSSGWYNLEDCDNRGAYPVRELELIDCILRMYIEPVLKLNKTKLEEHYTEVVARKEEILEKSGAEKDDLMSNPKFAQVLMSLGVVPPTKVSATTGKTAFAFAKTDQGMRDLLEHHDERVQAVVAARMGVKSTLEETRTARFINIAERGSKFAVPLSYSAARTHRLGGTDKINLQNLSARGVGAGKLKECIEPPEGFIIIDCDSSNIEARVLAWLAQQEDLVTDFANNVDVYCKMAARIYGREVTKENKPERFCGKTVVLGCGYSTGKVKLQATLKAATPPMELELDECDRIIKTYRSTYPMIPHLWHQGELAIEAMHQNKTMWLGREGVLLVDGKRGIKLPSGLYIQYPQLHRYKDKDTGRDKWAYKDEKGLVDIYGGKLIENVTQALARIIVMSQLLKISKRYKVVLTVHDAVASIAPKSEAAQAQAFVEECMRWVPKWAQGCPINCESGMGDNYGAC